MPINCGTPDPLALDFPARLENHDRSAEEPREGNLGQRAPAPADRGDRVPRGGDGEVASVSDAGDDSVVDPRIRLVTGLAREDADRRPAGRLRPARRGRHHLATPAADKHGASLGEEPADFLRARFVLGAAADDGDLNSHALRKAKGPDGPSPFSCLRSAAHGSVEAAVAACERRVADVPRDEARDRVTLRLIRPRVREGRDAAFVRKRVSGVTPCTWAPTGAAETAAPAAIATTSTARKMDFRMRLLSLCVQPVRVPSPRGFPPLREI